MPSVNILGGAKLRGEVPIFGMKNAVLPCIAATILTREPVTLKNVPRITDAANMLKIIESLGGTVEWIEEHTVKIQCDNLDFNLLDKKQVKSMRSSVLLMGPLMARFKQIELSEPGGCILGNRPLDDHIAVFRGFGAEVKRIEGGLKLSATELKGSTFFARFSVTATENALMAASLANGTTTIKLAAREPHVCNLIDMLVGMGARISGRGTSTITIVGIDALKGSTHAIIPDQIEIGTFIAAAAATRGDIHMRPIVPEHLDAVFALMDKMGLPYEINGDSLHVMPNGSLKAFKLQTGPYPAFPTDLQAPFGVVAMQAAGTSLIQETMFEGRLGYINELTKMGGNATICDPHRVLITGPTPLYGREIRSIDLRAGATLVIAALIAEGESTIHDAHILDRGYYKWDKRLAALGAVIKKELPQPIEQAVKQIQKHAQTSPQ